MITEAGKVLLHLLKIRDRTRFRNLIFTNLFPGHFAPTLFSFDKVCEVLDPKKTIVTFSLDYSLVTFPA